MNQPYPLVEAAVVLITDRDGRYLLDFNDSWSSFTFPTTKLHDVPTMAPGVPTKPEAQPVAAARAAAEVLGRPIDPKALKPLTIEVPPYAQSGRDGDWKRYTFRLFTLKVTGEPKPLPGHAAVWLTRSELESLEPISPTVRTILAAM